MSNSTEIFSPTAQMENIVVSMIIYVTGILGLLSNGGAIVAVRENFELRNLFRIVYLSRSVSNMGVQLIFLFWNTPTILLRDKTEAEMIDKVLGLMLIILWNVSVYLRLAMSLNRIIAIILPLQASSIFDMKNSFIAVFLCWLFALCHVVPYLLADECLIIFNKATWVWTFLDSTCGHSIPIFTNFYSTIVVLILIFLLDCSTIISLRVKNTERNALIRERVSLGAAERRRRQTVTRFSAQIDTTEDPFSPFPPYYENNPNKAIYATSNNIEEVKLQSK